MMGKEMALRESTEKELRDVARALGRVLREGSGNVEQGERLAEIRRMVKRIDAVKYGESW